MLEIFKIARSTYYYHLQSQKDKYGVEKQEIVEIFDKNKGRYGYRRILLELKAKGYVIKRKTVLKLMKCLSLQGKQKRSKYKSYKGEVGKTAPNIISRNFTSNKPFKKLTTDVAEFAVCEEKVYLSPILDMYNNEIVSYSISKNANINQTREKFESVNALKKALHNYITYYNNKRIVTKLKTSPIKYRTCH